MKRLKESHFAYILLAPCILLVLLLIGYPMINNIIISFYKIPLNPKLPSDFIGLKNYIDTFSDINFYKSLVTTILFTASVVVLSTALGLFVAIYINREFKFKKTVKALIILPYIVPSIALIFSWKYMFNNIYGVVNYILVDVLHLFNAAPLWFDNEYSAFILVVLFSVWRFFPYAFISFYAILQTIDSSLYEAAEIDGANGWHKFKYITIPEIMPVLATIVTLRTIWVFYMFTEVYLLTKEVNTISVYLYMVAFARKDMGKAAAISIILFIIIFTIILSGRKRVLKDAGSE
ncbi:sugar ABC transporter permease [Tepidanaerobacter syntrophicus]|uniref:Multiple sugar transport system permease protein n=1 Tax=Tepidanaerobacter syntrophicus TaxID=224999 RepID=A0A0U9HI30_9FIRM|nr:sugar ABC transporter permease [Tepidanaerobacter syntrophicus]GAQ24940.1 multiple sugar transport system permease protein [Tepidanaerobacter syntrophicus]GLI19769.1 sugar ABC transporter permease [Tepidanaerobacter syntrophicus]GLI51386.1 sugar ABC transporter permease [Tepidanaerobacter syntrophicus]